MRTSERHELKHDRFAETAAETYSWAAAHRNKIVFVVIAVAVVLAVLLGGMYFMRNRSEQANASLSDALNTYTAPVVPPGAPSPEPGTRTFASAAERAKAANGEFLRIADQYGSTKPGKIARYFAGISALDMGDASAGERELKAVADNADKDLASTAKVALAGLYRNTNRQQQAIDIYKQLIENPTATVGKTAAQLELASAYEDSNPTEAVRIYEEISKEAADTAAAEIAAARLASVRAQ